MKAKVAISILDQGLMSAFNFALNLALLKWWSSEQFGLYSLIFTFSFMLISVQNALITTPYSVLVPSSEQPDPIRQILSAANLCLLLVLSLLCFVVNLWPDLGMTELSPAAVSAYLCTRWIREYFRAQYAAELQLLPVLLTDLLAILLFGVAAAGWLVAVGHTSLQLNQLLWLLVFSQLLASVNMLKQELQRLTRVRWRTLVSQYQPVWQQSRWSLLGALTTELQTRGYVLILGAAFGAAWVGLIQAGRVFFGPLNVITSAWARVARPILAKHYSQQQLPAFMRLTHLGSLGFILFNALFGLALYLAWPWLAQQFFADLSLDDVPLTSLEGLSIAWFVSQWAIATLLMHVRGSYSTAVQAQNRFKPLSFATLWGALISLLSWGLIILFDQPSWVIGTVILAELLVLFYVLRLLSPSTMNEHPQVKPC